MTYVYVLETVPTSTKGDPIKIGYRIWYPRETLEKRLDKTPSNARRFEQG
jgi:hypothetical protein